MKAHRVFAVLCLLAAAPLGAAELQVTITDRDGQPLPGATVTLVDPGGEGVTDTSGVVRLETPAGHRDVNVRLAGFAGARVGVDVAEGRTNQLAVKLSDAYHFTESVTVGPGGRDTFEAYQPTSVLGAEDLQQRVGASLGETLAHEAGVNVRALGPGPARPVVRGLDGDRVLILENGTRTGDLSSQSADHGVGVDPASASQIEVVRGPATLLYGSNALGGVVNLVSDAIPTRPVQGVRGALVAQGGTVNREAGGSGNLTFGNGKLAVRLAANGHRTSDTDTPEGEIPNSQSRLASGGGAVAWTSDRGYLGASYQYVDTRYGVPFVEEGETTLTPRRHAVDLRGERRGMSGIFSGLKVQGSYRNYKHEEIEGSGEIATAFRNETFEGEVLLSQRRSGRLSGTLGVWGLHRDYTSQGEEALAPATQQRGLAAFAYEELGFRHLSLQFGARLDHSSYAPDASTTPDREDIRDRSFTNLSASLGVSAHLRDDLTLAASLARAARTPSLEELYNLGPHAGNFAFEIGNPGLGTEVGLGVDLSLRYRGERANAELTLFRNAISDFVFPLQTGEEEDGLPVVEFVQADSTLLGAEAHLDVRLRGSFWLELGADAVRGEIDGSGDPLPRMPPYRGWTALRYQTRRFHLEAEVRSARRQDRIYGAETATGGYAVVNLHGSYTFTQARAAHTFTVRLDNAADELYRNHLSYVKDLAPEAGRSFKVVYGLRF